VEVGKRWGRLFCEPHIRIREDLGWREKDQRGEVDSFVEERRVILDMLLGRGGGGWGKAKSEETGEARCEKGKMREGWGGERGRREGVLFLRIVYWQQFSRMAFNYYFLSP